MKTNIYLGELFIKNTLDNVEVKTQMQSRSTKIYILRAMMAGILVTFGYIMIMAMDAAFNLEVDVIGKMVGASLFSLTLAAIYYTKSELLTSNMMMVSVAKYYNKIDIKTIIKILAICYLGNIIGGLIISILVATSSILSPDMVDSMAHSIAHKQDFIANQAYWDLFVRAIFANFFINVAMLMIYSQNITSDSGKIAAMFFGVFSFVFLGFEHSVANSMLFITGGVYQIITGVTVGFNLVLALSNLFIVLIGNFIGGGVLIGFYYAYINDASHEKDKK